MKKTYQNYMIEPRENSTWWNVLKDGQFLNTVRDEEAARQVVWNETGKGEYITDEMMSSVSIVDPKMTYGINGLENILLNAEVSMNFENFMEGVAEVFNSNGISPHDEVPMSTKILKNGELEICQYIAGKQHSFIVPKGQWVIKQGDQL